MVFKYLPLHFFIEFAHPLLADNYPPFILRGVFGQQLRRASCVNRNKNIKCDQCIFRQSCAYAVIFETIVQQDNKIHRGTIRASHPFAITQNLHYDFRTTTISKYNFTITLFGEAINYLPQVYQAFYLAGQNGLFHQRVPYTITDITYCNKSIFNNGRIIAPLQPLVFETNCTGDEYAGFIKVEFLSPCRYQTNGRYTIDFTPENFWASLYRRAYNLNCLYGSNQNMPNFDKRSINQRICEDGRVWQQYTHYSARQKYAMELGGAVGHFVLQGIFTDEQLNMLEFAKITNACKNAGFGLGQIDFEERLVPHN